MMVVARCTSVCLLLCILIDPLIVHGSQKKGISGWSGSVTCDDFKVLNNMSWFYDWKMDLSMYTTRMSHEHCLTSEYQQYLPEHVPMVWSYTNKTHVNIPTDAKFILGFNEPNHADQADMTPQQAADAWPEIERHSHGKPLVGPVMAGRNFHWLDSFFQLCHGCRVDYMAAHYYNCDAHQTMTFLKDMYHRYGKKIWLTEFACPHTNDIHRQLHLMQTLLPQLEAAHYVFRYSWFQARVNRVFGDGFITPSAGLLVTDSTGTTSLTTIGKFYNDFHSHSPQLVG